MDSIDEVSLSQLNTGCYVLLQPELVKHHANQWLVNQK
jgi:hypothetical protein